jgi:hypothetical protein
VSWRLTELPEVPAVGALPIRRVARLDISRGAALRPQGRQGKCAHGRSSGEERRSERHHGDGKYDHLELEFEGIEVYARNDCRSNREGAIYGGFLGFRGREAAFCFIAEALRPLDQSDMVVWTSRLEVLDILIYMDVKRSYRH